MKVFGTLLKGFQGKGSSQPAATTNSATISFKPWNFICISGLKKAIQYLEKYITSSKGLFSIRSVSTTAIEECIQMNNLSDTFLSSLDNLYDIGLGMRQFLASHEPLISYNVYEEFLSPNANYEKLFAVLRPLNDNILETILTLFIKLLTSTTAPQYRITCEELINDIGLLLLRNKDEDYRIVPASSQELQVRSETVYKILSYHARKAFQIELSPLLSGNLVITPQKSVLNMSNTSSLGNITMLQEPEDSSEAIPMHDRSVKVSFIHPTNKPDKDELKKMLSSYGNIINIGYKEKIAVVLYELPHSAILAAEENAFTSQFKIKYLGTLTMKDPIVTNLMHPSPMKAAVNISISTPQKESNPNHTGIAELPYQEPAAHSATNTPRAMSTPMKTPGKRTLTLEEQYHFTQQNDHNNASTPMKPHQNQSAPSPMPTDTIPPTNNATTVVRAGTTSGDVTSLGMSSLDMSAISKVYEDDQDMHQHYLSKISLLRPDITTLHHPPVTPHRLPQVMEDADEEEASHHKSLAQRTLLAEHSRNSSFISESSESLVSGVTAAATDSGGWKTASGGDGKKKELYHRAKPVDHEIVNDTILTVHPSTPMKSTQAPASSNLHSPVMVVLQEEAEIEQINTTQAPSSPVSPTSATKKRTLKTIKVGSPSSDLSVKSDSLTYEHKEKPFPAFGSVTEKSMSDHRLSTFSDDEDNRRSESGGSDNVSESDSDNDLPTYGHVIPLPVATPLPTSHKTKTIEYRTPSKQSNHPPKATPRKDNLPRDHHTKRDDEHDEQINNDDKKKVQHTFSTTNTDSRDLSKPPVSLDQQQQQSIKSQQIAEKVEKLQAKKANDVVINYRPPLQFSPEHSLSLSSDHEISSVIEKKDNKETLENLKKVYQNTVISTSIPSKPSFTTSIPSEDFFAQLQSLQSLLQTTQHQVQSLQQTLHQQDQTYQQSLLSYQVQIMALQDEKQRLVSEFTSLKCDFQQLQAKQIVTSLKTPQQQVLLDKESKSHKDMMQLYLHQQSLIGLLEEENKARKAHCEALEGEAETLRSQLQDTVKEKVWFEEAYHKLLNNPQHRSKPPFVTIVDPLTHNNKPNKVHNTKETLDKENVQENQQPLNEEAAESQVLQAYAPVSNSAKELQISRDSDIKVLQSLLAQQTQSYKTKLQQWSSNPSQDNHNEEISPLPPRPPNPALLFIPPLPDINPSHYSDNPSTVSNGNSSYSAEVLAKISTTTTSRSKPQPQQRQEDQRYTSQRHLWQAQHHHHLSQPVQQTQLQSPRVSEEDMVMLQNHLYSQQQPPAGRQTMQYYPHLRASLISPQKPSNVMSFTTPLSTTVAPPPPRPPPATLQHNAALLGIAPTSATSNNMNSNNSLPSMAMFSEQLHRLNRPATTSSSSSSSSFTTSAFPSSLTTNNTTTTSSLSLQAKFLQL